MKNLSLALALIIPASLFSQSPVDITPAVKSVTLYQNGALVTHEGESALEVGKTTLRFHGLPSKIDRQSIQLSSNGDIIILSVTTHYDYLSMTRYSSKIKLWQDSLNLINDVLETINSKIDILTDAKELLKNNRTVGGTQTGTTVLAVKSMYDFYIKQMNIIEDSLRLLNKKQNRCENRMKKIANEINEWKTKTDTFASVVEASISSDKIQNVSFRLSYFTYDAKWSAVYDLRARDTKHPCQFSYKANISQHTGQDWNNIDLTLSSSNPVVNQTAPVLNPWYLAYYHPLQLKREMAPAARAMTQSNGLADAAEEDKLAFGTREVENTTTENQLSVEFHIDMPYSLLSDNKPHTVEIKKYVLNANYHYITIPKLQKDVFLLAGITKWEDLNLLAGEVNIYYSGAYVGKSNITPETTSDTLNFSLGMDKRIVLKRSRITDFSAAQWIGNNKTQTFGWAIELHNAQNDSISLDVFDQIPISTDKDIEISPIDLGGSTEDATGKLTWQVSLAAGETRKLTFSYSVKYPKDKVIQNLWQ